MVAKQSAALASRGRAVLWLQGERIQVYRVGAAVELDEQPRRPRGLLERTHHEERAGRFGDAGLHAMASVLADHARHAGDCPSGRQVERFLSETPRRLMIGPRCSGGGTLDQGERQGAGAVARAASRAMGC
jgi:hypothetical protein